MFRSFLRQSWHASTRTGRVHLPRRVGRPGCGARVLRSAAFGTRRSASPRAHILASSGSLLPPPAPHSQLQTRDLNTMGPLYREILAKQVPPSYELGADGVEHTVFGGGCFWGLELAFQRVPGVVRTAVGYMGGGVDMPSYTQVCTGATGHAEVVQVVFDPQIVTFAELIDAFGELHDPTQVDRQGNDYGTQYRSAVFCASEEQRREAAAWVTRRQPASPPLIATEIVGPPASAASTVVGIDDAGPFAPDGAADKRLVFWPAEPVHQSYLRARGQRAAKGCDDDIRCYG